MTDYYNGYFSERSNHTSPVYIKLNDAAATTRKTLVCCLHFNMCDFMQNSQVFNLYIFLLVKRIQTLNLGARARVMGGWETCKLVS